MVVSGAGPVAGSAETVSGSDVTSMTTGVFAARPAVRGAERVGEGHGVCSTAGPLFRAPVYRLVSPGAVWAKRCRSSHRRRC